MKYIISSEQALMSNYVIKQVIFYVINKIDQVIGA